MKYIALASILAIGLIALVALYKKSGTVSGHITIYGLPSHKMYSASVTLFPVAAGNSPPPFDGAPPAQEWIDTQSIKEADEPEEKTLSFKLQRTPGFYYLGVSVIAYIERDGKLIAHVERFLPMSKPCHISSRPLQPLILDVAWPDVPFNQLQSYGTIYPATQ